MPEVMPVRLVVEQPPRGVSFQVQRRNGHLLPPAGASFDTIVFDLTLQVGAGRDGHPVLRGEFAQGPPDGRFIYLNSGQRAGEAGSAWDRRAKIPLAGISPAMIEEVLDAGDAVLEGRIAGISRDGGPACASVEVRWRVLPSRRD